MNKGNIFGGNKRYETENERTALVHYLFSFAPYEQMSFVLLEKCPPGCTKTWCDRYSCGGNCSIILSSQLRGTRQQDVAVVQGISLDTLAVTFLLMMMRDRNQI